MSAESRRIALPTGVELQVQLFDFTDPWKPADTLLLLRSMRQPNQSRTPP